MNFEEWLLKAGELFDTLEPEGGTIDDLPDTFVLKRPLSNMFSSIHYDHMEIKRYRGVLFRGKEGCGRHTLMNAFVQTLCAFKNTYDIVRLRSEDFSAEAIKSDEDALMFIDALYESANRASTTGVIVFDQMETYERLDIICNRIADNAADEDYNKVYTICISTEEAEIKQELSSVLFNCRCPLPPKPARKKFFLNNLSWDVPDWENEHGIRTFSINFEGISIDELVEKTAGFSYAELTDFLTYIKMDVSGRSLENLPSNSFVIDREQCEEYISISHFANENNAGIAVVQEQASQIPRMSNGLSNDIKNRMKELDAKGGKRTFEEDMFSIDSVKPLNEDN